MTTEQPARTDLIRAGLVLWGGWLIVTALVFSYMSGTTHPYYAVALAPAIGALVGIGGHLCWQRRAELTGRLALAAMVLVTGVWDYVLLNRTPTFLPWLRFAVLGVGVLVAAFLLVGGRRLGRLVPAVVLALVIALGLGSSAYAASTAAQSHTGSTPSSGPSNAQTGGPGGGMRPGAQQYQDGGASSSQPPRGQGGGGGRGQVGSEVTALLTKTTSTWAAAVNDSQTAAALELATGKSVIGIGGWSGSDNAPTLAQFQQYVADGKIAYYISGGQGGGRGGSNSAASEIQAWVEANYTATTVGSSTVYQLIY